MGLFEISVHRQNQPFGKTIRPRRVFPCPLLKITGFCRKGAPLENHSPAWYAVRDTARKRAPAAPSDTVRTKF
jgi:hypothetical protein